MGFSKKEAPNCDWCPARKNCFYELLEDKSSKKAWREIRIANRFRSNETVFYEGENPSGIYVVCTGKIKILKASRTGQQLLLRFESPGDLVGHISSLAGWPYAGSAEAMEESVVSMIDIETFKKFLLHHPRSALALLREVSRDVRRGEAKARDIAFKPARGRLAGTLLRTVPEAAVKKNQAVISGLKRKDIAEMAGLTIETTVRLLKDFENRGLVARKGKDIQVLDVEKLKSLSGHFS
ncbi:MAG: Crp/Fnr family transcriptional regulator [Elusimicrobia bacterium]|nr:Crp/Fnr family transcriptional regulator [Elusimicrobiota bacterium]